METAQWENVASLWAVYVTNNRLYILRNIYIRAGKINLTNTLYLRLLLPGIRLTNTIIPILPRKDSIKSILLSCIPGSNVRNVRLYTRKEQDLRSYVHYVVAGEVILQITAVLPGTRCSLLLVWWHLPVSRVLLDLLGKGPHIVIPW